jgi:hypothetical protein
VEEIEIETARGLTLFPGNLLKYFSVVFAVIVTALEFIRVAQKGACMSFTMDWKVTQSNIDRIIRGGARAWSRGMNISGRVRN